MIAFHRDTPSNLQIDAEVPVSVSLHQLRENIGELTTTPGGIDSNLVQSFLQSRKVKIKAN